jgi:hypothetical protein
MAAHFDKTNGAIRRKEKTTMSKKHPTKDNNATTADNVQAQSTGEAMEDWVWKPFIARKDVFVFVTSMKGGKSTFTRALAESVARATSFLGHKCKKGGVLILGSDVHPRSSEPSFRKLHINLLPDNLYVDGNLPLESARAVERIAAFVREKEIALILVDSFAYDWDIDSENGRAELQPVKPLLELAKDTEAAIGLMHYETRSHQERKSKNIPGSLLAEAHLWETFGIIDRIILMDHVHDVSGNKRVIQTKGRYTDCPTELAVELIKNPHLNGRSEYGYILSGMARKKEVLRTGELEDENKKDLVDAANKMLEYHLQGNKDCDGCYSDHYPMPCQCGGLIHASSGPFTSSECATSFYFKTVCDKCAHFTTQEIWEFDYTLYPYIEAGDIKRGLPKDKTTTDRRLVNRGSAIRADTYQPVTTSSGDPR